MSGLRRRDAFYFVAIGTFYNSKDSAYFGPRNIVNPGFCSIHPFFRSDFIIHIRLLHANGSQFTVRCILALASSHRTRQLLSGTMEKSQVGKISFRLALSRQVSSSCQAGRKRKTPTSVNETNAEAKTLQAAHDTNSVAIVGWIFTPLNSSQEYLLSVSMTLAKKTCDAARFQQTVRLDRYVQFFLKAQPASAEHPDPMNVVLVEVPDDALSIVDPGSPC